MKGERRPYVAELCNVGVGELLDAADSDWTLSADAVRYRGNPLACAADQEVAPRVGLAMSRINELFEAMGLALRCLMEAVEAAHPALRGFVGTHDGAVRVARGFRIKAWWVLDEPCACHPAPFPAARDYRRRTRRRRSRSR